MKHFIAFLLIFSISATFVAQTKPSKSSTSKQYRSAESGRYVTKSTAQKTPSTTYSTTRKSKK
ncbi:MAG TPA: hypothetical protein DEB37_03805 [Lysinibacillus sp.]|nr:hypothetical protein [Lysinibacillus sp.]